jgi:surface antigen
MKIRIMLMIALLATTAVTTKTQAAKSKEVHDSSYLQAINYATPDQVDPWNFYGRECVSYVAYRIRKDGFDFSNNYRGVRWGWAYNWANAAQAAGIYISDTPQKGAVAWFKNYGHVAYVEKFNKKKMKVEISEYNGRAPHQYGTRTINADEARYIIFDNACYAPVMLITGYGDLENRADASSANGTYLVLKKNRTVTYSFAIRSIGEADLEDVVPRLRNADSGFAISRWPKETISSGRYSMLEIEFFGANKGTYYTDVEVKSNDTTWRFQLKAKVK